MFQYLTRLGSHSFPMKCVQVQVGNPSTKKFFLVLGTRTADSRVVYINESPTIGGQSCQSIFSLHWSRLDLMSVVLIRTQSALIFYESTSVRNSILRQSLGQVSSGISFRRTILVLRFNNDSEPVRSGNNFHRTILAWNSDFCEWLGASRIREQISQSHLVSGLSNWTAGDLQSKSNESINFYLYSAKSQPK